MLIPRYRPAEALGAAAPSASAGGADPLDGRTVAVTGATGGLGTALCLELARRGATVVLLGRRLKRLERLYDMLEAVEGGRAVREPAMLELDLATLDADGANGVADTLMREFGRLDALVHAAADPSVPAPQTGVDDAELARAMRVNVAGPRLLTLACLPLLEHSAHASVAFVLDHKPGAYFGAYGLSKTALHALAHVLAEETEGRRRADGHPRVAVNGYDPGPIRTNLRRRFFAGEVASAAPPPEDRLAPLLALVRRDDPALTGQAFAWDRDVATGPGGAHADARRAAP